MLRYIRILKTRQLTVKMKWMRNLRPPVLKFEAEDYREDIARIAEIYSMLQDISTDEVKSFTKSGNILN